jgi:phage head maturation protease
MPEWFKTGGNIREQHSSIAAGVAKELDSKADGHYISVLVVDAQSVKKVETGVLKGFSIGIRAPRIVRDNKAANGRIIDGQIVEVSLVDRPANPNAKLNVWQSHNGTASSERVEQFIEQRRRNSTSCNYRAIGEVIEARSC